MAILRGTKLTKVTGSTTNATPTAFDLFDFATPGFCEAINNQGAYVEIVAIGRNASTGATASAKISGVAKRLTGTLTFIESGAAVLLGLADLTIAAAVLQGSGTKIQVLVTGIILTNINWTFHTQVWTD